MIGRKVSFIFSDQKWQKNTDCEYYGLGPHMVGKSQNNVNYRLFMIKTPLKA